jgi:hypothetical protein
MVKLEVKCAGVLPCTGKEYEFVAKFGFLQETPNVYSGPIVYEIGENEEITLFAPEKAIIMERERENLVWLHWEEQFTKRVVKSRKLVLSPPQPSHQIWWMNYSPPPPPPKPPPFPLVATLGPISLGAALSLASKLKGRASMASLTTHGLSSSSGIYLGDLYTSLAATSMASSSSCIWDWPLCAKF